jgi:hypothetical protein
MCLTLLFKNKIFTTFYPSKHFDQNGNNDASMIFYLHDLSPSVIERYSSLQELESRRSCRNEAPFGWDTVLWFHRIHKLEFNAF